jgi:hypothetical protein
LKITYIPTGGYSYPVQFKFKLIAIWLFLSII